jgi:hypothetical protein
MNPVLLPICVRLHLRRARLRDRAMEAWKERHDELGMDEAVTKMIWLAVGVGVAVAATAFFVNVFNSAKASVPDPVPAVP